MASTTAADAPRRTPWRAHALFAALYGALLALYLLAPPVVTGASLLLLILLAVALFTALCVLGVWMQRKHWGTFIAVSFAPSRIAVAVLIAGTSLLPPVVLEGVPVLWRAVTVLALTVLAFVLLRWDDGVTVEQLRARGTSTRSPGSDHARS